MREYRARVQQAMQQGPEPSVQLRLSPFIGTGSPLEAARAQARSDVTYGRHPLGQEAPPVSRIETPPYSHGSFTAVSYPDLSVQVALGPVLWSHVERAGGTPHVLDVTA